MLTAVRIPDHRILNRVLTESVGREVVALESLPMLANDVIALEFVSVRSEWRQGVWLGTEGALRVGGETAPQFVIWSDTAPSVVPVTCEASDGSLRLYNIWNTGQHQGHRSQSHTSGMLVDELADGASRYRCNDIGADPTFETLVFTIRHQR